MTTSALAPTVPPASPTARRHRWGRVLVVLVVIGAVADLMVGDGWLASAFTALTAASPAWSTAAVALSLASMVAFAGVRRSTLRAAGVRVPLHRTVSMSFAAGAVHTTLPGGAVFATAYAFRRMRAWGASTPVATWCLTVSGVLAAATLAMVGIGGFALGGTSVSGTRLAIEVGALALVLTLLVRLTRHPRSVLPAARLGLRLVNRVRSRPATAGLTALTTLVEDLATIRPTRRHWIESTGWSLANWLLDAACLGAASAAVGVHVSTATLVVTYAAGMVAVSASPLPAGLGVVETVLAVGLTAGGAPAAAAVAAVLVYRLAAVGSVVVVGWTVLGLGGPGMRAVTLPPTGLPGVSPSPRRR